MSLSNAEPSRIVVIARPAVGRQIVQSLSGSGYEVFRTPSALDLPALVDRIRPHLAIVAIDLIGQDGIRAALEFCEASRGGPVLLIGEARFDPRVADFPVISSSRDRELFIETVRGLLASRKQAA